MKITRLVKYLITSNKTYTPETIVQKNFDLKRIKGVSSDVFQKEPARNFVYDINTHVGKLYNNGKESGEIKFSCKADNFVQEGFPEYYFYTKDKVRCYKAHVCVRTLDVDERGRGTGTRLMKEAVKVSLRDDLDGRVFVNAMCTDEKTSPCVFYYKLGFRCVTPKKNEQIINAIKNLTVLPSTFEDWMYLPRENIIHLLKK